MTVGPENHDEKTARNVVKYVSIGHTILFIMILAFLNAVGYWTYDMYGNILPGGGWPPQSYRILEDICYHVYNPFKLILILGCSVWINTIIIRKLMKKWGLNAIGIWNLFVIGVSGASALLIVHIAFAPQRMIDAEEKRRIAAETRGP